MSRVGEKSFTDWAAISREKVLEELERVLASTQFHSSRKCSRFFRHIVECALDQRFERLKERTLGVDVFERDAQYDTNQDPIVRGTAGEVRKRLAQYYLTTGQPDEVRFSLPAGSYIPEIELNAAAAPVAAAIVTAASTERGSSASPFVARAPRQWLRRKLKPFAFAFLALGVSAASLWLVVGKRSSPLDQFWGPVFQGHQTILVCMGQPKEYTFRSETAKALDAWFSGKKDDQATPVTPPFASVPFGEILPLWRDSVSLSDTRGLARMYYLFARMGKQADLRGDGAVTLSDLRARPAVLIGAFDNQWTLNLSGDLRFYFEEDVSRHAQVVRDRLHPEEAHELIEPWPPSNHIETDYAVVTRVRSRTTEQMLVTVAGISQFGTEAAAEFVTNADYLRQALVKAPADWPRKNMQVVLSTRVLSQTSGPPVVVAAYFW